MVVTEVTPSAEKPAVILVRPQLAENIGTTTRAMLNCGLTELRLVAPREDWLSERAIAASSGADALLRAAQRFDTTEEAITDLHRIYATTARNRFMVKPVVTPRQAAAELRQHIVDGSRCGVLFGPERTGLENDDVALADVVITVPLNPDYCSLNLAQSVLLVAYEWFQAGDPAAPRAMTKGATPVAVKKDLVGLFEHLERELDDCGFFRVAEKRPVMVRNIRNMFERADLTQQEVRTLHGIVHELVTWRRKKAEAEEA
ncbi:RNA methyltransferase [Telmatospirillum sp.]|uniref:RNA methyltransferase n=1 Tax=Telmatospirillum sp. TaxID=2079197 RepID=UPI0028424262|nr:RNA methyltransferase [Telmatospirillum sp.]MDR3439503.1 RNA methyltransferase [Telmatospirillum sp.]